MAGSRKTRTMQCQHFTFRQGRVVCGYGVWANLASRPCGVWANLASRPCGVWANLASRPRGVWVRCVYVCICMYVYVYVCMMRICSCVCVYVYVCTRVSCVICFCVCVYVCTHHYITLYISLLLHSVVVLGFANNFIAPTNHR